MNEFKSEKEFEAALTELLTHKGWEEDILSYPTEEDLIKNWANILYENNRHKDRLGDYPLTTGEMEQILDTIRNLKTPLKLSEFINGKSVAIKRDNPADELHYGKEVSLKIYDRKEIAAGQSRYQIARQPRFKAKTSILPDRRGDFVLLINGMPVIHVELKKSGVSVSQATNQIEKYAHEGVFTGLFSLVQIFVAMAPNETKYFANPGPDVDHFNTDFFFHWADFNNEPINDWKRIADRLLSIPMAHQMIGFYTVADGGDGILKVMRSYQYYAANGISDRVAKIKWDGSDRLGGYIWHTTGSGKTMTSFKSAQLIANSKDADKVVFLMDRIELGTQSLKEYRNFAEVTDDVQETEDTAVLIDKLKSDSVSDTLIVTSIQKMSNLKDGDDSRAADLATINEKRIVFIVDECHRSTFGSMLLTIKAALPNAVFFGFTGTPIQEENQKKDNTTSTVFGNEIHRYSIADGIRDKNVLAFDTEPILTFKDNAMRKEVALRKAGAISEADALGDPKKSEIYYHYMDKKKVPMAGYRGEDGKWVKGIEDFVPTSQYETEGHVNIVIKDIKENFARLSHNGLFHAIFATSSIPEAVKYYRRMKELLPHLKITCLYDPSIDNTEGAIVKEDALVELIEDYNKRYEQNFSLKSGKGERSFAMMKKDIAARLSHKEPYQHLPKEKQIDILIVVDQMLTGFDSKWINTLYLDKVLRYENIIQAFSRTNRLFGKEKPFGTIRWYRKTHTMEENVKEAVKLYSGDKPFGMFVEKLEANLHQLNEYFREIKSLFEHAGIENFQKLPEDKSVRAKFAKTFAKFNDCLESAKVQGFHWSKLTYDFKHKGKKTSFVTLEIDENTYLILVLRYKELFSGGGGGSEDEPPYDIEPSIIEIDTNRIDTDYMNSRFEKYLRELGQEGIDPKEMESTLSDLHKSFAVLTTDEQKFANIFLHDVEAGNIQMVQGKTFRDYITIYAQKEKNEHIAMVVNGLGVDEKKLRDILKTAPTETNINEFGRFDDLLETLDKAKAKKFLAEREGKVIPVPMVKILSSKLLREFILTGNL
ncbi:MAG: HsdR family type I site-specific deoxyribonuclease [Butyrivibrio sp.]|nr:HsdR family type I site-specific deoxyribonuclease [Butyrivibrio sp.]